MRTPLAAAALVGCTLVVASPASGGGQALWDSGDPTAPEQFVLEMVNRARADPAAEGQRLGIDINEGLPSGQTAVPRPPLAMNKALLGIARAHSADMHARDYFAHNDLEGNSPFQRMQTAGYSYNSAGENIAASSYHDAAGLEDLLVVDAGISGRGHRVNLLNTGGSVFREVGLGYFSGSTPNTRGFSNFLTQDFGRSATGPFVVGVVYDDASGNGLYDEGEGLSGVTVEPGTGGWYAVTGAAGGYAFPVATSGTVTVTVSGGSFGAPVQRLIQLTGENVKADFRAGQVAPTPSNSQSDTDGDGFCDELETALGTSPYVSGDTPFGGAPAASQPLSVPKLKISLNFATPERDAVTFAARLPVPEGFSPEGRRVVLDIGGVIRDVTLDAKGRAVLGTAEFVRLKLRKAKGAVPAQDARLTVTISKSALAALFADEGLTNATTSGVSPVTLPVIVLFEGASYATTKPLGWRAKTGERGSAR
jgi:uncharacterized protein YkwD